MKLFAHKKFQGFTLIELIVSLAIFGLMTALIVVKYGNFNQSVLLTDLAYEVALTVRTAQTYGLSVKGVLIGTGSQFNAAYGVNFIKTGSNNCGTANSSNTQFVMFADINTAPPNSNGICTNQDEFINSYNLKRGAIIGELCAGSDESSCNLNQVSQLDITFKRPEPDAVIYAGGLNSTPPYNYAKITLKAVDGNTRSVVVYKNGQIAVTD